MDAMFSTQGFNKLHIHWLITVVGQNAKMGLSHVPVPSLFRVNHERDRRNFFLNFIGYKRKWLQGQTPIF